MRIFTIMPNSSQNNVTLIALDDLGGDHLYHSNHVVVVLTIYVYQNFTNTNYPK